MLRRGATAGIEPVEPPDEPEALENSGLSRPGFSVYNWRMQAHVEQTYQPELIPRRGEWVAWGLTAGTLLAWLGLGVVGLPVAWWGLPLFSAFLLFCAAIISLGNWIDRHTRISVLEDGLLFSDGLRSVRMGWDEVQEVRVFPSQWGGKIQVFSTTQYFSYRSLGEVVLGGESRGVMGFKQGQQILRQIIVNSQLRIVDRPGEGIYYARS